MLKKLYDKLGSYVTSPYANYILASLFFIEAIFFIPVDPLLVLFCLHNRKKSFFYATIATLSSVAGGICAYYCGLLLWESVGERLISLACSPQQFQNALLYFKEYENWAVIIGGLTPIPYKVITLSAGFCKLPLAPFIFFSLLARGIRFFLISSVIYVWGQAIKEYIDRYFNILVLLFTLLVFAGFVFFL